ncbi:MAG TPA: serine hydrolase domain-containing protein, partial [Acidimicrobiales bacterium]|nr:serine hydrolase domain-containing protein [Acidimicrobiales bacterium]
MPKAFTTQGLDRFAEVAASHTGNDRVPGLVALMASGDEVHVEVHGNLSVHGSRVNRDSVFRIASTTKPITGAATLALIEEGLLALEDPVDKWLPELANRRVLRTIDGPLDDTVPAARPVTVRDLLTFTFGFGMCDEMFMASGPWPVVEAANRLDLAALGPPDPGTQPDPDTWIQRLGT